MNSPHSTHTVAELLAVDGRRSAGGRAKLRTHPFIFMILNLFFCGYYHQFLRADVEGHHLTVFILMQASLIAVLTVGSLLQFTAEIMRKSIIFPTTSWNRLVFVLASTLRRPLIVAIWLSSALFLGVVLHKDAPTLVAGILAFSIMAVDVVVVAAIFFFIGLRSHILAAGVGVLAGMLLFTALVAAVVFRMESILGGIPLVTWTAATIVATAKRALPVAAVNASLLILVLIGGFFVGKKIG